jgi:hypothetical protein
MVLPYGDLFRLLTPPVASSTGGSSSLTDINLVITGGGFSFYYATGICGVLAELKRSQRLRIHHYYGVSSGALACACLLADINITTWIDHYPKIYNEYNDPEGQGRDFIGIFRDILHTHLPDDIHLRANGILHITVRPYKSLLQTHVISQYPSRQYLIDALLGSCSIPYISINALGYCLEIDGSPSLVIDGVTPPQPCHHDNEYPTLEVNLMSYNLSYAEKFRPTLTSIDFLVMHGCIDIYKFLVKNGTPTVASPATTTMIDTNRSLIAANNAQVLAIVPPLPPLMASLDPHQHLTLYNKVQTLW